jgi:transposase
MQCTLKEIAGFFDCSEDTIERWCKRTYKENFADTYKTHSASGLISLRRNQFELSKRSAAMAIWLGKQYLDQKDSIEVESSITDNTREEIGVLIDELNKTRSGTDTDVDTV